jgi:hypothetical protein
MRRDARFYKGLQARGRCIAFVIAMATVLPSPAAAGDIAGRVDVVRRAPKVGEPGFGDPGGWHPDLAERPPVLLIRSPEMVTTRRSGPRTFERRIVDGHVMPPYEALRLDDTLEVTNADPEPRRLFAFVGAATRLIGPLAPGESTRIRLERFGWLELSTDAAGATRSLVLVAENPFLAEAAPDGRFLMDGVPPGTFDVVAFLPGRRSAPARVVVDFSGVASATLRLR